MVLRRHLDNGRFSVASGFMAIFPDFFVVDHLLSQYDITKSTVDWSRFQLALHEHFRRHFRNKDPNNGLQKYSVFHRCSRSLLLHVGSSLPSDTVEQPVAPMPKVSLFTPRSAVSEINLLPENKGRWSLNETDEAVARQLRFYVPALIWAYNELKKALLDEDAHISRLRSILKAQDEHQLVAPLPVLNPNMLRFAAGTALTMRGEDYWKKAIRYMMGQRQAEESAREAKKQASKDARRTTKHQPKVDTPSSIPPDDEKDDYWKPGFLSKYPSLITLRRKRSEQDSDEEVSDLEDKLPKRPANWVPADSTGMYYLGIRLGSFNTTDMPSKQVPRPPTSS